MVSKEATVSEPVDLLRRLARHDEHSLRTVLAPLPPLASDSDWCGESLDRRTRLLVRLAALFVIDAPTNSLRWAVDLACTTGADDDDVAAVLLAAGLAAGSAQLVASAPRLALALGFEPGEPATKERSLHTSSRGGQRSATGRSPL
jgi:hypothetical protein